MRRRRHRLEVSTFPFLAVLLCAMGSLILLLLVLDRRAKVVAAAKLRHQAEAVLEERNAAANEAKRAAAERLALRQRDWEARHSQLLQEQDAIRRRRQETESRRLTVDRQTREVQQQALELARLLLKDRADLQETERGLAAKHSDTVEAEKRTKAAQTEIERLTIHLAGLEEVLAALKQARLRDAQTFSVVPYKGKRGETRRPIYVECTATGLLFHPEGVLVRGPGLSGGAVRAEVDRRLSREGISGNPPYVMMLVRPDGIGIYYETLAALRGKDLEFGYEFVDASWVFHFPTEDGTGAPLWPESPSRDVETALPGIKPRRAGGVSPLSPSTQATNTDSVAAPPVVARSPDRAAKADRRSPIAPSDVARSPDRATEADRRSPNAPQSREEKGDLRSANVAQSVDRATTTGDRATTSGDRATTSAPRSPGPVRYLGNRDWVIAIRCLPDGLVLESAGQKLPLSALSAEQGRESVFLTSVRQWIARRQALVRPGEPPYRPQVRFLVPPDALRTYHLAYPALEPLNIPLTRQNVD